MVVSRIWSSLSIDWFAHSSSVSRQRIPPCLWLLDEHNGRSSFE